MSYYFNFEYNSTIQESIKKIIDGINVSFKPLQEVIQAINFPTSKLDIDFEKIISSLDESVKKIAEKGWTIDKSFTPSSIIELSELTQAELDDSFVLYYEENNYTHFNSVINRIIKHDLFKKWEILLNQCSYNIKLNNIEITIPSLLIVFEGVLADFLKTAEYGYKLKNRINEIVTNEKNVSSIMWSSIISFFNIINSNQKFDENRPETINRHRILHGRDAVVWNKADAYRLINAFYTIVILFK